MVAAVEQPLVASISAAMENKASGRFLQAALLAIIDKFTDDDKLEPPADSMVTKVKAKLQKESSNGATELRKTVFADLPKEIRDAFFHGTKRRLTFKHGDYKYESEWKGALRAMRERATEVGGDVTIDDLDGKGTALLVRLPVDRSAPRGGVT